MAQTKVDPKELSEKIEHLLKVKSLAGAVMLLRSVDPDVAYKVIESLPQGDQKKLYDLWLAAEEKPADLTTLNKEIEDAIGKEKQKKLEKIRFYPDHMVSEFTAMLWIVCLISLMTIFLPAGLEARANAAITPQAVKPEWYFLFLYAFLRFVPPIIGVMMPFVGIAGLFLLPFLDKNPEIKPMKRKVGMLVLAGIAIFIITFSLIGYFE